MIKEKVVKEYFCDICKLKIHEGSYVTKAQFDLFDVIATGDISTPYYLCQECFSALERITAFISQSTGIKISLIWDKYSVYDYGELIRTSD